MRAPTMLPALAFVAAVATGVSGILPGLQTDPALTDAAIVTLPLASLALSRSRRSVVLVPALVALGILHGGTARESALHPSLRTVLDGAIGGFAIDAGGAVRPHAPLPLRARLTEDASTAGEFVSLRVEATEVQINRVWVDVAGGLVVTVNGAAGRDRLAEWRKGRRLEMPVTFRRPARYLDEGVPDFERQAALGGIALFGSVKSPLLVQVIRRGSRLEEATADVRAMVRRAVTRWVAPHDPLAAAIVSAVLIGDRTGLPDEVRERLQAAGTYHVIAISGGNIAILAALIVGACALLGIPGPWAAVAAIALLSLYAQVASAGPSVWRATLMALLYFAARAFDHRTPPWHAIAVAAATMALVRPLDVRDAGFLLTFGATLGLLAAARWTTVRGPGTGPLRWVALSVIASAAAELALLPVSAGVFSRITGAGLVLNLLAIPLMAVVQVAGLVAVFCAGVTFVALPAGWLAAHAASLLVASASLVDYVPWLVRRVPPPPAWMVIAYYAALLAARVSTERRTRIASSLALAISLLLIVTGLDPFARRPPNRGMRLTMIDVGQGEALLVEPAVGEPLLIDTGGSPFGSGAFDIGARVIAPVLWHHGIRRLGVLALTHGDPDHIGGAPVALADFAPRTLWWGITVPRHRPSTDLQREAAARGIPIQQLRAGEVLETGGARVRVLNPPEPDWERQRVRNDDSIVLEVVYGDVAILLTGDISADVERTIAPHLTPAGTRVLKVAHHGSRTSSSPALLDIWRPTLALISSGRGNTFGHPTPEVLERLASIGARTYRTDRDGEITLETDGRSVSVRTFTGGAGR